MRYITIVLAATLASCAAHAGSHTTGQSSPAAAAAGNCARSNQTGTQVGVAPGVRCTIEPNDYVFTSVAAAQTETVPNDRSTDAFPVGQPGDCVIGDVHGNIFACTIRGTAPWIWAKVPTFTDDAGYLKDGVTVYLDGVTVYLRVGT
jgi:FlaG/FlaF family flagellin (archaellin)